MSLNIKDREAHRLASELARRNGETLTAAVLIALRERLERQKREAGKEDRLEWLRRITAETAKIMDDGRSSKEIMDELYDEETGLPK